MSKLFTPIRLGNIDLKNRMVMAPLTRGRAGPSRVPNDIMAEYYAQRAGAGLIVTEATAISAQGYGWPHAPAIYTDEMTEGWKKTTEAVHNKGGLIFLQLWHMGRVSHPDFLDGDLPVAPSAIRAEGESHTLSGKKPYVTPRALTKEDIQSTLEEYKHAAKLAKEAGFDGVEIHGANGYLIDQFLRDGSNQRDDEYGGSAENRTRFLKEVIDAVKTIFDDGQIGVRISPTNPFNDMKDSNPAATFTEVAIMLNQYDLAYLHVMEPIQEDHRMASNDDDYVTPKIRAAYAGALMINGGYSKQTGENALDNNAGDLVAYGVPFIANPDLVERFKKDASLNPPDESTFYGGDAEGYTDYPFLDDVKTAA